jgi:protein-S-isoprenylcysteine O-methyltransferase Ste14
MPDKPQFDAIKRGVKRASPFGTSLFVGLRALDVFIQYGILAKGLADPILNRLSIANAPSNAGPIVALGLSLKPLIVLGFSAGTAIKQIYWVLFLSQEEMPPSNAIPIAVFNTLFNSPNSILSMTAAASYLAPAILTTPDEQTGLSPLFLIGTFAFVLGSIVEVGSEVQRKSFKKDPRNAGKPYTGGLFGLARHINYSAYAVMRSGAALATGGWVWGSIIAGFFFRDFATRGVPILDEYCTKRYGATWLEFKKRVPYKLVPGIY